MTSLDPFEVEFRQVFENQFPSLHRYLNRLCGDEAQASDIAQEAFIRLYQRGELPLEPRSWLVSVAHNLLRDERRRGQRRLRILKRWSEQPSAVVLSTPESVLIGDERRRAVRGVLSAMTLRDRQLLLLRHEGYSYREIAAALHLPASSVGTLLARAKAQFRMAFEERHGTPE